MTVNDARLGLVCITTDDSVRYKTITRTRLFALPQDQQRVRLRELYVHNIGRLSAALDFCTAEQISLYRMPSGMFPSSEDSPGFEVLQELAAMLSEVGARARERNIRLVSHPDQFVVLNSESDAVCRNSVAILEHHARVMDMLGQPRSHWSTIEIHGGKGGRGEQLIAAVRALPDSVRSRIALENDEYTYSASQIVDICRRAEVPMVFDAHHHLCSEGLASYDDPSVEHFVREAAKTWSDASWQMVHISNGRERFDDPKHADYIKVMPSAFRDVPWIEVEAKMKERAIRRLKKTWSKPRAKSRLT